MCWKERERERENVPFAMFLCLGSFFTLNLGIECLRISFQDCLDRIISDLVMFTIVVTISTVTTYTVHTSCETFTVELQTLALLTVARFSNRDWN